MAKFCEIKPVECKCNGVCPFLGQKVVTEDKNKKKRKDG